MQRIRGGLARHPAVVVARREKDMLIGSFGLIPRAVCTDTTALSFKAEFNGAVDTCLQLSPKGD